MLGLYYNFWPHPMLFWKARKETTTDLSLTKRKTVYNSNSKCSADGGSKKHVDCIRNWLRDMFDQANCDKGCICVPYITNIVY